MLRLSGFEDFGVKKLLDIKDALKLEEYIKYYSTDTHKMKKEYKEKILARIEEIKKAF